MEIRPFFESHLQRPTVGVGLGGEPGLGLSVLPPMLTAAAACPTGIRRGSTTWTTGFGHPDYSV
jgi:hypothetical protein